MRLFLLALFFVAACDGDTPNPGPGPEPEPKPKEDSFVVESEGRCAEEPCLKAEVKMNEGHEDRLEVLRATVRTSVKALESRE